MRTLDQKHLATILGALKLYQTSGFGRKGVYRPDWMNEIVTDHGRVVALDDRGIESLCNDLNKQIAQLNREERLRAA